VIERSRADLLDAQELAGVSKSLSWLFLVGFLVVSNAARGVYSSHGLKPSGRFEALCAVSLLIFTWYWLMQQCRPYDASFPLDIALFAFALWFAVLPYYLWRYERWRGLFKVTVIAGAYVLSYAVAIAVHYMLL
jgi:hypothetical protein